MLWRSKLPGRVPPRRCAGHAQRLEQAVKRARAGGEQGLAHIRVDPPVIFLIRGQPLRQERVQACATGLKSPEPDRFKHRQQHLWLILLGPPNDRWGVHRLRHWPAVAQRANSGLAMIAKHLHSLIQQLGFILRARLRIRTSHFRQHFLACFLTHFGVHLR